MEVGIVMLKEYSGIGKDRIGSGTKKPVRRGKIKIGVRSMILSANRIPIIGIRRWCQM